MIGGAIVNGSSNNGRGHKGPTGAEGPQGIQGNPGTNGIDGTNGTNGIDGINGTNGINGATGPAGVAGATGATGPIGPTGPTGSPFVNSGTNLTFSFSLTLSLAVGLGTSFIPYVIAPDGTTYEGPAVNSTLLGLSINFAPITVPNAVYGSYVFGYQTNALVGANASLIGNATATRDGSTTTIVIPATMGLISIGRSQTNGVFVFDDASVP